MKYGTKYVVKWTPQLVRQIVLVAVAIFIVGGGIGYTIATVSAQTTTVEVAESNPSIETIDVATTHPVDSIEIYYDCPLSCDLQDYIRMLCEKNDIPMSLIIALIDVESSFRPNVVSETNDYGLMQINIGNHKWLYENHGITDIFDPYQNIFSGITLLCEKYDGVQSLNKSLMVYNLGIGKAKQLWAQGVYETAYTKMVLSKMEVYDAQI